LKRSGSEEIITSEARELQYQLEVIGKKPGTLHRQVTREEKSKTIQGKKLRKAVEGSRAQKQRLVGRKRAAHWREKRRGKTGE